MESCLYKFKDGKRTGFPAVGFKAAIVRGGKMLLYELADLQENIFVMPDEGDLVEIQGDYALRTDMVRVGMGNTDRRHRPEYRNWKANLKIKYNEVLFSENEIMTSVDLAGFHIGIGEWRPEKAKTGNYGTWKLINK